MNWTLILSASAAPIRKSLPGMRARFGGETLHVNGGMYMP
jgi:hypothetical protein